MVTEISVNEFLKACQDKIKQDQMPKTPSQCKWLRDKYGEDAVVTKYGRIKSLKIEKEATSKPSVGWSSNPKRYQKYKDSDCYEDIPYTFPF